MTYSQACRSRFWMVYYLAAAGICTSVALWLVLFGEMTDDADRWWVVVNALAAVWMGWCWRRERRRPLPLDKKQWESVMRPKEEL